MTLTINGQKIELSERIEIRLDIDPAGETFPCINIDLHGGQARFFDPDGAGLKIISSGGKLEFGNRDQVIQYPKIA